MEMVSRLLRREHLRRDLCAATFAPRLMRRATFAPGDFCAATFAPGDLCAATFAPDDFCAATIINNYEKLRPDLTIEDVG